MADMELIIKIPDHLYKLLKDFPSDSNEGNIENVLMKAVEHGIPLPKGHGDLVDLDELIKYMKDTRAYDIPFALAHIKPIIEADKEQTE